MSVSQMSATPIEICVGEKTYKIRALSIDQWGEFEQWMRDQVHLSLVGLDRLALPDETKDRLTQAAFDLAAAVRAEYATWDISDEEAANMRPIARRALEYVRNTLRSAKGNAKLMQLTIVNPKLTEAQAFELLGHPEYEQHARRVRRLAWGIDVAQEDKDESEKKDDHAKQDGDGASMTSSDS